MSEPAQDPLRRICSGDEGFVNETRLLQRIDENIRHHRGYWHLLNALGTAAVGLTNLGLLGRTIAINQIEVFDLVMRGLIITGCGVLTVLNARLHMGKRKRLQQAVLRDSYYLVWQAHQNQRPYEKYDPARGYQDVNKFLFDHPSISPQLFRQLEKRANGMAQEYENRLQEQNIHESMDRARKILRSTVKRATRTYGTEQQKRIVNSKTNHRAMLIELARDDNGLTAINSLRHLMGWNRAR